MREQVIGEAIREFDDDLAFEAPVVTTPGVDAERIMRARSNALAVQGLMRDLNAAEASG